MQASLQRSMQASLQRSMQASLQKSMQASLQRSMQASLQKSMQASLQKSMQASQGDQLSSVSATPVQFLYGLQNNHRKCIASTQLDLLKPDMEIKHADQKSCHELHSCDRKFIFE